MTNVITCDQLAPDGQAILVYGHFTAIHAGHLRFLRYAKAQGGALIVALTGEVPHNLLHSQFSQQERADSLAALNLVDSIVLLKSKELVDVVSQLRPKIILLGGEHEFDVDKNISLALDKQKSLGGSILFHPGEVHYASADLLVNPESLIAKMRLEQFRLALKRQNITRFDLVDSMLHWKNAKIAVIGDVIVDQYIACEAIGMSAEAPVIVVKEMQQQRYVGGAAIVASHLSALGAKCSLVSVIGDDEEGGFLELELKKGNVDARLVKDSSRPTTRKKRYVVENQKLFRVSRLDERRLDKAIENEIINQIRFIADKVDGIIVSDFVYGVITPRVLDYIQEIACVNGILLFGDLQCSSQIGAITKFKNFTVLCPNEREARISLQDKDSGLEFICQEVLKRSNCKNLIMKLGSDGFIAFDQICEGQFKRESFPALTVNPIDVAGAGDSLLAAIALGVSTRQPLMVTAALAACVASLAVERMGNISVTTDELKGRIESSFQN